MGTITKNPGVMEQMAQSGQPAGMRATACAAVLQIHMVPKGVLAVLLPLAHMQTGSIRVAWPANQSHCATRLSASYENWGPVADLVLHCCSQYQYRWDISGAGLTEPGLAADMQKQMMTFQKGGPWLQARNFAIFSGVNAGLSTGMRRFRKKEDVRNTYAPVFLLSMFWPILSPA